MTKPLSQERARLAIAAKIVAKIERMLLWTFWITWCLRSRSKLAATFVIFTWLIRLSYFISSDSVNLNYSSDLAGFRLLFPVTDSSLTGVVETVVPVATTSGTGDAISVASYWDGTHRISVGEGFAGDLYMMIIWWIIIIRWAVCNKERLRTGEWIRRRCWFIFFISWWLIIVCWFRRNCIWFVRLIINRMITFCWIYWFLIYLISCLHHL